MKMYHLDDSHSRYVVIAESFDDAWKKLEKYGIAQYGSDFDAAEDAGLCPACYDMEEIVGDVLWADYDFGSIYSEMRSGKR